MKASCPGAKFVTRDGKPVSVILSINKYEQLLKWARDAEGLARLKRSREKYRDKPRPRSLDEYLATKGKRGRRRNPLCILEREIENKFWAEYPGFHRLRIS